MMDHAEGPAGGPGYRPGCTTQSESAMAGPDGLPVAVFASRAAWGAWLGDHHAGSAGLWLKIPKRGRDVPSVTYEEALLGALAFGWIDGQKAPLDEAWWLQRFTPRRPRSRWSKANRARAERLIAEGAMQPAGLRQVELARADGRWDRAYDGQRAATVPDDLRAALDATNRYAVLYRVQDAKRPETRARRIERFVAMLAAREMLHPPSECRQP